MGLDSQGKEGYHDWVGQSLNAEAHEEKGKPLIGPGACPHFLSPAASSSLVPSHERSMHQKLPSSERGAAVRGGFH